MPEINILEQLNDSQREAVVYCDGAQLVIAGAGSGKTRVLTYKIAYLLQHEQLPPWNILALTFTNKAAREMKERIARLVGDVRARYLQMGTFHSVFARILRSEAAVLGFQGNFTIYDQADSRSLVKAICREMGLDDKVYKPSAVADAISMAKNHLIGPIDFPRSSFCDPRQPLVSDIYSRYVERCKQANVMDFDDLLVMTFRLFNEHDDIRQKYVERFRYVLVDEYQDTNYVQQSIVLQLTRERQKVCVVGDDAQSIYSFRGANIDNILHFREAYTNARLFKLEQNYRSTQLIVEAANSLISKNRDQIPKDVYSRGDHGERLQLKAAVSDREEANIVCNEIRRLRRKENMEWTDFAILYRTNAQSRSFEEQMRKDDIPYRIYGGMSFYQRKEIKDIIAYFRLVANPDDEEALRRIINYPTRGIGDTTMLKIGAAATQHGVSLWTVIAQPPLFGVAIAKATVNKLGAFCQLVEGWRARLGTDDAYELGKTIVQESGVALDIYSNRDPEDLARQENLQEFMAGVKDFVEARREEGREQQTRLSDFLQEVALLTDFDSDSDADAPRVSLMTIHSAKGLEFPTVFIVGLEENIFPSPLSVGSARQIEEERRLLYVAITRAERHCILTYAQTRFRYGRLESGVPSRFIRDIDPGLMQVDDSEWKAKDPQQLKPSRMPFQRESFAPVAPRSSTAVAPRVIPPQRLKPVSSMHPAATVSPVGSLLALRVGSVIEHQRFGVGTVTALDGAGDNQKATVAFRNAGTKQLLLKYARYKVVTP